MTEIRGVIGTETPVYLSFDIDGLDPLCRARHRHTPNPEDLARFRVLKLFVAAGD